MCLFTKSINATKTFNYAYASCRFFSVNGSYNRSNANLISKRLNHFIVRGKKETRESNRRNYFLTQAYSRYKRTSVKEISSSNTSTSTSSVDNMPTGISQLFKFLYNYATPFVSLKRRRRRRGKQSFYKVRQFEYTRGESKAFSAFAEALNTTGAVSKPFTYRFGRELDNIVSYRQARTQPTLKASNTTRYATINQIREKADQVHRQAYKARPYR